MSVKVPFAGQLSANTVTSMSAVGSSLGIAKQSNVVKGFRRKCWQADWQKPPVNSGPSYAEATALLTTMDSGGFGWNAYVDRSGGFDAAGNPFGPQTGVINLAGTQAYQPLIVANTSFLGGFWVVRDTSWEPSSAAVAPPNGVNKTAVMKSQVQTNFDCDYILIKVLISPLDHTGIARPLENAFAPLVFSQIGAGTLAAYDIMELPAPDNPPTDPTQAQCGRVIFIHGKTYAEAVAFFS